MKISVFILSVFLLSTSFFGCVKEPSDSVNQDKIYTEYELSYNGNQDKSYARAWFKFSNIAGTLLELKSPSQVTFNGDILTYNSVLGYYEKEYAGLKTSGSFIWTDFDGNSFTNSITLKAINYPVTLDTINKNAAFEMFWVGDSLSANESVSLTIDGLYENDLQIFYQDDLNSKSIIMALNQLQLVAVGNATLYMDRYYTPILQNKTSAGGTIKGTYRPINKTVYVK